MSASKGIDPRGPRFTAALTVVVLVAILAVESASTATAVVLTAVQTLFFTIGAIGGVQRTPHSWLFRRLVRPRLAPPAEREDPAPPRFAQGVGLVFTAVALIAFAAGTSTVASVAVGLALVAAVLNAVFGLCLGCELYLLLRRLSPSPKHV